MEWSIEINITLGNLGWNFDNQEKYKEAQFFFRRCFSGRTEANGREH